MRKYLILLPLLSLLISCSEGSGVSSEPFGRLSTGEEISLLHLENKSGAYVDLTDYGARLLRVVVPDREGKLADVTVGYANLDSLERGKERFIGCTIGRFGNRINNASFTLDGVTYNLEANENRAGVPVQCHGGPQGFDRKVWDYTIIQENGRCGVRFHYLSPDGEQGYPGNCDCHVTYWWSDNNALRIEYEATTDKPTVINLSNHTYFNLKGDEAGYVLDHELYVACDTCIIMNPQDCPDSLISVEGTEYDYRTLRRMDKNGLGPRGISASWLIRDWNGEEKMIAELYDPTSGRFVETWSTEPCLLTWSAAGMKGISVGKFGPMEKFCGMLLETIHVPDSPNQSRFPGTVLRPGERYHSSTEYRFGVR